MLRGVLYIYIVCTYSLCISFCQSKVIKKRKRNNRRPKASSQEIPPELEKQVTDIWESADINDGK